MAKTTNKTNTTKPEHAHTASVVEPLVKFEGQKHILQELNESENAPILKSIGYTRLGDKRYNWVSYVITTQGDKVLKVEVAEPDMRAIADEASKMNFVTCFSDTDLL